jgi:hypothetical protein
VDFAAFATLVTQLGVAVAAWKLANALKLRVEDHERRIVRLEAIPSSTLALVERSK